MQDSAPVPGSAQESETLGGAPIEQHKLAAEIGEDYRVPGFNLDKTRGVLCISTFGTRSSAVRTLAMTNR
jgi:hypothetical protein